ncbi:MAG: mechanosensitive ion channel family protein [Candidatus Micrarchaeota archaeon]|nr:mechanosensitive ion channel family protein [Candidatus Micrarchaeota archaeon]
MAVFMGIEFNWQEWALALGIFFGSILLAHLVIVAIDKLIRPLVAMTKTKLDDFLFENLRGPLKLLFAVFGAYYGLQLVQPGLNVAGYNLDGLLFFALIIAVGHGVARTVSAVLKWYVTEIDSGQKSRLGDIFPILSKIAQGTVYFAILVILLSEWGLEIGPLIAGLGVAGLAVALALQDSLKNFFAGIYILADKPIRKGSFVAVDSDSSGIRGWVEEIGWRSTRLRTRKGHTYILPNERLASSVMINYDKYKGPKRAEAVVGAEYGAEPEKVMAALLEACNVATKALEVADKEARPIVRQERYADSSIEYRAIIHVKSVLDEPDARSELNKQIHHAFRKNGLTIPFPIRTLYMHEKRGKAQKRA